LPRKNKKACFYLFFLLIFNLLVVKNRKIYIG